MTTTLVLVSDFHCNSKVGLSPPSVNLYGGGTYRASRPQRWVYSRFRAFCDGVGEARQRDGGRLVMVLNGELADDNKHSKYELIELHPDAMMTVAIDALKPLIDHLQEGDLLYVTRGTEAHSGPDSWMDNRIGADLGAVSPAEGVHSFVGLMLSIDGVRVKGAHHPPLGPGRLPWTSGQFAQRVASHVFYSAVRNNEQPPDIYFSGHYHVPGDSYDTLPTRALALPSWQLPTSYSARIGADRPLPVGGVIVTCDRGRYEVAKSLYEWPIRRYEIV